jgi:hypothetical protein
MAIDEQRGKDNVEETPPFGTWALWYVVVLLALLGMIVLSYWFTAIYS